MQSMQLDDEPVLTRTHVMRMHSQNNISKLKNVPLHQTSFPPEIEPTSATLAVKDKD